MRLDYKVSYRKKDGSIQCIIAYKDGDKWRQKSKQGFKTQKESKPWQDETLKELREIIKTPVEYRKLTWGEFKDIFLEDKKREYAYNSTHFYKRAFRRFEDLDNIPILELGYINIKPCVDKMIDDGLKVTTIKDYLGKLRTALNHAIDSYEILSENPVKIKQYSFTAIEKEQLDIDELESDKVKALNESELEYLLNNLTGPDYYRTLIAAKCGLRMGEINGLVDGSIDFKNRKIIINRQWKRLGEKEYGFGTLKTKNSYREVPIPSKYMPELREYVRTCVKDINNRIFIDYDNTITTNRLNYKYKNLGFDISLHNLRHTYATTLLANGFDFKTIANLMGDTVETVIKVYSHFTDDMMKNAEKRIDNIL